MLPFSNENEMEHQHSASAKLNECKYLYLDKAETGPDHSLLIHVVEAKAQSTPIATGLPEIDSGDIPVFPISVDETCNAFKITFEGYILYSVTDETHALVEETEDYSSLLRTYKSSRFLEFVDKKTWDFEDGPSIKHYVIVCLNHVIDVACKSEPIIEIGSIDPDTLWRMQD